MDPSYKGSNIPASKIITGMMNSMLRSSLVFEENEASDMPFQNRSYP